MIRVEDNASIGENTYNVASIDGDTFVCSGGDTYKIADITAINGTLVAPAESIEPEVAQEVQEVVQEPKKVAKKTPKKKVKSDEVESTDSNVSD